MGLLDRFKRGKGEAKVPGVEKDELAVSVLILKNADYPLKSLVRHLDKDPIFGRKVSLTKADSNIYTGEFSPGVLSLAVMPGPYPWSDLEGPCETSWTWPDGTSSMVCKEGQAFLLVTLVGDDLARIPRRQYVTQLTAKATQSDVVLGVYWPTATMVHHPKLFRDLAKACTEPDMPPLHLWVDYRIYPNKDGTCGMFTTGMRALGLMELEVSSAEMTPEELREWAMNITFYQLEEGPVMKDGQTIGMTEKASYRIKYRKSRFGHEGLIMALEPMG